MALQAIVRRGYTFSRTGERITTDKLNAVGLPIVDIVGTVDSASIGTSITNANVSASAAIEISKLRASDNNALIYSDGSGDLQSDATITGDITVTVSSGIDLQIGADKVTTAKILDANVTTAKIADANVTLAKLAADVEWVPDRIPAGSSVSSVGGAATVDCSTGYVHQVTLAQAAVTITISNLENGQSILLMLVQDAGGSRVPTIGGTIAWRGGVLPTWSTGPNEVDAVSIWKTSGGSVYASAGINFATP